MPRKSWWARLPFGVRMTAGTSALLLVMGAGVAGVAVLTKDSPDAPRIVTAIGQADAPQVKDEVPAPAPPPHVSAQPGLDPVGSLSRTTGQSDWTGPRDPLFPAEAPPKAGTKTATTTTPAKTAPTRTAPTKTTPTRTTPTKKTQAPKPTVPDSRPPAPPSITTRTDVEKREVPFQTRFVRDPWLPRGARKVTTAGVPGEETLRYLVTLTDGKETNRKLLDITVTREPQHRVITFGSRRGFGSRPHQGVPGLDECGRELDLCASLGRKAPPQCPAEPPATNGVSVLDQELVDLDVLTVAPAQMDCAVEPAVPTLPQ